MLQEFKFHHIGVATNSIDSTSSHYVEAGYTKTETVYDPIQNVNICFLQKEEMPSIELLEPIDEKSPVFRLVKTSGVAPYHCCYLVDNILDSIAELRKKGFVPLTKPTPAIAIEGKEICFLYNKAVGLIELLNK